MNKNTNQIKHAALTKKEKGRFKKLKSRSLYSQSQSCANNSSGGGGGCYSGIVSFQEAEEYQSLVQKLQDCDDTNNTYTGTGTGTRQSSLSLGPSIHISSNKEERGSQNKLLDSPRMTEGSDHCNLIHALLFQKGAASHEEQQKQHQQQQQKHNNHDSSSDEDTSRDIIQNKNDKKRKNDPEENYNINHGNSASIPSWATIHNPALLHNVVILEFNLQNKLQTDTSIKKSSPSDTNGQTTTPILQSSLLAKLSSLSCTARDSDNDDKNKNGDSKNNTSYEGRQALYTKMRLFQSDRPRHLTDLLMHFDSSSSSSSSKSNSNGTSSNKKVKTNHHHDKNIEISSTSATTKTVTSSCTSSSTATSSIKVNIHSLLEPLLLSQKSLRKEGYPLRRNIRPSNRTTTRKQKQPQDINNQHHDDTQKINDENHTKTEQLLLEKAKEMFRTTHTTDTVMNVKKPFFTQTKSKDIIHQLQIQTEQQYEYEGRKGDSNDDDEDDVGNDNHERTYVATFLQRGIVSRSSSLLPHDEYTPSIYGLDCEMVRTSQGLELARITLIQFLMTSTDRTEIHMKGAIEGIKGNEGEWYNVVMDLYVKPKNRIRDYLTRYSGITAKILENVNTSIEEIQATLLTLICEDDILVGHSLENDLRALQCVHTKVIDTAVLFRSKDGRKHSLKHLTACLLQRKIQQASQIGHCSEEDAHASLLLAVHRARLGPTFKLYDKKDHRRNLMSTLTKVRRRDILNQPMFFQRNMGPIICLGPSEWIKENVGQSHQNVAHVLECESIKSSATKAVASYLRPGSRNACLLWSKLNVNDEYEVDYSSTIDSFLSNILGVAPSSTMFLIVFQEGYADAKKLYKQRLVAKDARSTLGWSNEQEDKLKHVVDIARYCDAYWIGAAN